MSLNKKKSFQTCEQKTGTL